MAKKIEINENWEPVEVEDLSNLFVVLFKQGSFDQGYVEAFDTDDVLMQSAYDNLAKQYGDCGCDECTKIYLIKLPNTAQVQGMCNTGLFNGNCCDPHVIEATRDLFNRADCEQISCWEGCGLTEGKKKKKVCSSSYCGFTDPALNIAHFNKCMGTGGLQNPDAPHLVVGDTLPNSPVADTGSSAGASDAGSSSGEGMGESLTEAAKKHKADKDTLIDVGVVEDDDLAFLLKAKGPQLVILISSAFANAIEAILLAMLTENKALVTEIKDIIFATYDISLEDLKFALKQNLSNTDIMARLREVCNGDRDGDDELKEDLEKELKIQNNENIEKDIEELEPPIDPEYFPNNMGINLCSVKKEKWVQQDDGQLKTITIEFDPATEEEKEEQGGIPGEEVEESLTEASDPISRVEQVKTEVERDGESPITIGGAGYVADLIIIRKVDNKYTAIGHTSTESGYEDDYEIFSSANEGYFDTFEEVLKYLLDEGYFDNKDNSTYADFSRADIEQYLNSKNESLNESLLVLDLPVISTKKYNNILKDTDEYYRMKHRQLVAFKNVVIEDEDTNKQYKLQPNEFYVCTKIVGDDKYSGMQVFNSALAFSLEPTLKTLGINNPRIVSETETAPNQISKHLNYVESLTEAKNEEMYIVAALYGDGGGNQVYYIGYDYKAALKEYKKDAKDWVKYGLGGGDTAVALIQYNDDKALFDKAIADYIEKNGHICFYDYFNDTDCDVLDETWDEIDESLTEATLDYYTQKQKMQQLNNGTRGFNAKASSDEKLKYNRKVCQTEGYNIALDIIEAEMVARNLIKVEDTRKWKAANPQPAPQPTATPATNPAPQANANGEVLVSASGAVLLQHRELTFGLALLVSKHSNAKNILDYCMAITGTTRQVLLALIYAICLKKDAEFIKALKDFLTINCSYSDDLIKETIRDCLGNKEKIDRVNDLIKRINDHNENKTESLTEDDQVALDLSEEVKLDEAKRYVKRYYVRPQNIFCSNKEDILKALLRVEGENCSIYSLKDLADHDDVQDLKPSDIIYYYDDGILYDKNHVKVMDYDLNVKHEEERKKFADVDSAPTSQVNDVYDDRLTDADLQDKETVANFRAINARQMK